MPRAAADRRHPFAILLDLAGRRVRVASVNRSDLVIALGGTPIVVSLDRLLAVCQESRVDCAVTGTLPSGGTDLHRVTSHLSAVLLGWAKRCGIACAERWNGTAGPVLGVFARW